MNLSELFKYDPDTGHISRLVRMGNYRAGTTCTSPTTDLRYLKVRHKGRVWLQHRLAWELYYKEAPPAQIDHINGIGTDNRICNLRAACNSTNQMNIGVTSKSTTGIKGVFPVRGGKLYRAEVCVNGKRYQKHSVDPAKLVDWVQQKRAKLHGEYHHN